MGPRAFNLDGLELLVLDNEIPAFADLIPSRNVLPRDHHASLGFHVLLLQPVTGFPIDAIETDFFTQRRGWMKTDWPVNEGKPKITLPISARPLCGTPTYEDFCKWFRVCPRPECRVLRLSAVLAEFALSLSERASIHPSIRRELPC
jgi:hypothetical protein